MLDTFIFENHLGMRFIGLNNGVYLNYSELRDYSWNYDTINDRISRFYRGVTSRKIPLIVKCDTEERAAYVKNRLTELAEADIEARLPGKVYVGNYYTSGYITASKKGSYLIDNRFCTIELTLTSDNPAWYCEQTHVFIPGSEEMIGSGAGTDHPYDYPHDYALEMQGRNIICDAAGSSAFRLMIYGEITDPSVFIGDNVYTVHGEVKKGETLLIDSLAKTITLTTATGAKVNWFDKRGRDTYIFEPIPAGQNSVSWPGSFGFDLTVIEKRSEPKWT